MNIIKTLYRSCSRVSDMIDKVLKVILVLLVLGSALDLFLQVLYRFVLVHFVSFSMTWTNELAQNFLVWMTYLAVGICYKENSMASVNFLYDRLKPRSKMVLYLLTRVVVFIFLFVGLRFGWGIHSVRQQLPYRQPASAWIHGVWRTVSGLYSDDLRGYC